MTNTERIQANNVELRECIEITDSLSDAVEVVLQSKTVTPTESVQEVLADEGYTALEKITINPIPDEYQDVSEVTATADKVVSGSKFVDSTGIVEGTMKSHTNETYYAEPSLMTQDYDYEIPEGYHKDTKVKVNITNQTFTPNKEGEFWEAVSANAFANEIYINPIPDEYIIPSGELEITENGIHDVTEYASVNVNMESASPSDTSMEDIFVTRPSTFTSYTNNKVKTIGQGAFAYCSSLASVSFPACTSVGSSAFYGCTKLTSVSFPACTSIANNAFYGCSRLTTVDFPACTFVAMSAFDYCSSLTSVNFPACTSVGGSAFGHCLSLTSANFPICTSVGISAFNNCLSLTSANFPACTSIGVAAFYGCSSLTSVSFPVCTSIGNSAFGYCTKLTSVSFPACTSIGNNAFNKCYNLISLYLTGSAVCTLSNSNAFASTPIGGYSTSAGQYGNIFVPASLVDIYRSSTNWTYFSSRIVAYEE